MRILAFAASNHPQSINQQLALSVAKLLPQAQISSLELDDFDLPIYSERREAELGTPPQVQDFLQRISEADGVGGEHRLRHRQAERLPDAAAGLFGFQIPQRTIKRVARRTGGQQRQQIGTAGPRRHRAGTARQRRQGQFR